MRSSCSFRTGHQLKNNDDVFQKLLNLSWFITRHSTWDFGGVDIILIFFNIFILCVISFLYLKIFLLKKSFYKTIAVKNPNNSKYSKLVLREKTTFS